MSTLALTWAYAQKLRNPTAKSVLAFLASHNFGMNQSFFKIETICEATEFSERTVQNALTYLVEHDLLIKTPRFNENGRQVSNLYELNIPQSYVDKFINNHYGKQGGEGASPAGGRVQEMRGEGAGDAPLYNNNIINNKESNNSSLRAVPKSSNQKQEQKPSNLAEHPSSPSRANKQSHHNEQKHGFAQSMDQMAREKQHIEQHEAEKWAPMPEDLRRQYRAMLKTH